MHSSTANRVRLQALLGGAGKLGLAALLLTACTQLADGPDIAPIVGGPTVRMNFQRTADFYEAPFPSDELLREDGTLDPARLGQFPNPKRVEILNQALALILKDARGFAVSGAVFFSFTDDLGEPALPAVAASTGADAEVFLMDLESRTRHPVFIHYETDGGPYGAPNLLSLLPVQGIALRPGKTYAAVVRRSLLSAKGRPVTAPATLAQLIAGEQPAGLSGRAFMRYQAALRTLADAGVPGTDIAGLAVFTTDDPTAQLRVFRDDVLARPLPSPNAKLAPDEVFPDYCVYSSTIDLPDYQQGEAPYERTGGGWSVDPAGKPVAPHAERARLVVTIPRTPMPADGYPTVMLIRGGAGGDRPLVDRGVQAVHGGPPLVPGSGPAREFARVGFAGVQVDGPLGGLRNTTGGDEQFLIFNVFNATALRDNIRESALELILMAHLLPRLTVDAASCPGVAATVRLDEKRLALMGHSIGASIAPLVLAGEPLYRLAILSGAGGSYIENILWKRKPLEVLPLAESLLQYPADSHLHPSEPALTLVQWAAEPSDPPVYAHRIVHEPAAGAAPRHVLMEQGIVDNYILPNIANPSSLSLGLDLGGAPLDTDSVRLPQQTPVLAVLPLVGRGQIALPAAGNLTVGGMRVTAVVVQHPEDGVEDGHEIVFQTEPPKHQYRCFLASFAAGKIPVVPPDAAADAPCP